MMHSNTSKKSCLLTTLVLCLRAILMLGLLSALPKKEVMREGVVAAATIKVTMTPQMTGVRVGVEVTVGWQGEGSTNVSIQPATPLGVEWQPDSA